MAPAMRTRRARILLRTVLFLAPDGDHSAPSPSSSLATSQSRSRSSSASTPRYQSIQTLPHYSRSRTRSPMSEDHSLLSPLPTSSTSAVRPTGPAVPRLAIQP
ncbi:hypothetical protein L227DRAFT_358364 [Lentinus tigrinus ALCF2SS1-6]|uniref:Uncharacterized protein n=1 Tax=Lentinus tigrinus ALCF2SS1-6 TaxID=1328759 RepID=A0A5C2SIU5_9APHY|nr:hypothetical protein L227DRAFT_358364 [Lentinus tigrinus ALCF2SS1-6]